MKDFIQIVWHNEDFKDMVKPVFAKPAGADILDQYVRLAYDLNTAFGTMATVRVSKGEGPPRHELRIWHPTAENVIVVSCIHEAPDADSLVSTKNGTLYIREAYDGELEGYSAEPSVRPEHEGYMLRLVALGVYS